MNQSVKFSQTHDQDKQISASISLRAFVVRWGLLLALMLFAALSTLYWLHLNVSSFGRDAGGHLTTSLNYLPLLNEPSLRSFFEMLLINSYRPPILYLSALPFYALFGVSFDSGVYANIIWLCLTLVGIYAIGRQLRNHSVGVVAVGLYLLFPFVHSMARAFYFESALAAFVALNLALLIACEQFTQRRWTLLWGVSLGLGMLTKWTLPATVAIPTLYVLWRSGLLLQIFKEVPAFRIAWRSFLLALLLGSMLALLLLLPNHALVANTIFAYALYPLFAITWGLSIYTLTRPARPWSNLLSGLSLAMSLMAFWYFVQPGFVVDFVDTAYLGDEGRYSEFDPFSLKTYVYYLLSLYDELIGPLLFLLLLPFLSSWWPWWPWLRVRLSTPKQRNAAWVVWLAIASTYLIFTLARYQSQRSMLPLLVPLAVVLAAGALSLRPRVRKGLLLAVATVGVVQMAFYTLPVAASWLPALQQAPFPLLAQGEYLQHPTSGVTDPGFWIAPEVLQTIENAGNQPTSFGMLVNSAEIHRGPYRYLIKANEFEIELAKLTEKDNHWGDLFANKWILVKNGDNHDVEAPGLAAIERIANGDGLFHLLYEEAERYALPNGETAILYHRSQGPAFPYIAPDWLETTLPMAEAIKRWWHSDVTLLLTDPDVAIWTALHDLPDLPANRAAWLTPAQLPPVPPIESNTLFVLLSSESDEVEDWLEEEAYHATEIETERASLAVYGRPTQPLITTATDKRWGTVQLTELRSQPTMRVGGVLPVELSVAGELADNLKFSVRLMDASGNVAAQYDKRVKPKMRVGLFLPPDAPAGSYMLAITMYNADTLDPIPDNEGMPLVLLMMIDVR